MKIEAIRSIILSQMDNLGETYETLADNIGMDNITNLKLRITSKDMRYSNLKTICDALDIEMKFIPKRKLFLSEGER